MPGGGKSTIGRQLAKRLGWAFNDSDLVIEKEVNQSIKAFFEVNGEDRFRDIEAKVISKLCTVPGSVLATGGGAVLAEANRRELRENSHVVYLRSTPEEIFRRLRHDTQRPLLQVADPLAKLKLLHAQRDPLYREAAHLVIDTGRPSVSSVVNAVLMQLELDGVIDASEVPVHRLSKPRPS